MTFTLEISPEITSDELNGLFEEAWPNHTPVEVPILLSHALFYVCAFDERRLIGFAKVISDGGVHGFLLDPTVAPRWQRQGIGGKLVLHCIEEAGRRGIGWLHVDYEPRLKPFYLACGFRASEAGLINLSELMQNQDKQE